LLALRHHHRRGLARGRAERPGGPRLVATAAILMGSYGQSKRQGARIFEHVFGLPCSPGRVVTLQNQATAALRPAYEELVG
jgi:hypothetical protein